MRKKCIMNYKYFLLISSSKRFINSIYFQNYHPECQRDLCKHFEMIVFLELYLVWDKYWVPQLKEMLAYMDEITWHYTIKYINLIITEFRSHYYLFVTVQQVLYWHCLSPYLFMFYCRLCVLEPL